MPGLLLLPPPPTASLSRQVHFLTTCSAALPPAEFWENYTGPRIMTNKYVWAAAAVVATLAAVYSSERGWGPCWEGRGEEAGLAKHGSAAYAAASQVSKCRLVASRLTGPSLVLAMCR